MSINKKILVDARHQEEIRVAVFKNGQIQDFDAEITSNKQLKGNVYLGRITRIETSLQAAFVDYGGNRQGFLPFNEVALDYFNLPEEKLTELRQKERERIDEREKEWADRRQNKFQKVDKPKGDIPDDESSPESTTQETNIDISEEIIVKSSAAELRQDSNSAYDEDIEEEISIEKERTIQGERYGYKIHEVLQKDQLILIQVVKEERGSKGASLTSYLSLAGRYCVLMPNTPKTGGVSRKIGRSVDRERLRDILKNLEIAKGMNVIIRTAGADCTAEDITQDYDYLIRLWELIKKEAQQNTPPALIYEEASLLKRTLRDIYSDEVEEVIVDGDVAYDTIYNFAKLIAPDMVKKISKYNDQSGHSLFYKNHIEDTVEILYGPISPLKSGGYLVFAPSEALTTIDVNSGRGTSEKNVEETALKTNLEAADELARQLRLRNIAGLVVVDFIDMELQKNRLAVERRLREALKRDKARTHLGSISDFGLLELSRQRISPSLLEKNFHICPTCQGIGRARPVDLNVLSIFRKISSDLEKYSGEKLRKFKISLHSEEAFFLLNEKRKDISNLESKLNLKIQILIKEELLYPYYEISEIKEKVQSLEETPTTIDQELKNIVQQRKENNTNNNNRRKRADDYNNKDRKNNNQQRRKNNNRYNNKNNNGNKGNRKPAKTGIFSKIKGLFS